MTAAAQQAMSVADKARSAREEVKCQDEPSAEVSDLLNHNIFIEPLAEFVADLGKLISINKSDLAERYVDEISIETSRDGRMSISGSSSGNSWLHVATQAAAEEIAYNFSTDDEFYRYDEDWKQEVKHTVVTFLLEDSGLTVTAKHEHQLPQLAQKHAAVYNSYFSFGRCSADGEAKVILYQNTKALTENNQVLVVTRLPRAALAELLAAKPAAN
jgi:hypothetical protein